MTLEEARAIKIVDICNDFDNKFHEGMQSSLGFVVDCKREDLQNLDILYNFLINTGKIDSDIVVVRDFNNNFQQITLSNLKVIITELQGYGLNSFQIKWNREIAAQNATSIEELSLI